MMSMGIWNQESTCICLRIQRHSIYFNFLQSRSISFNFVQLLLIYFIPATIAFALKLFHVNRICFRSLSIQTRPAFEPFAKVAFAFEPFHTNLICLRPESPKSIGLRTLPPLRNLPSNPLVQTTICVLILSTGVEPESPKSIGLRTLPPKSFVWVSDKIWNSKHKTKKKLYPQYFLKHGHV